MTDHGQGHGLGYETQIDRQLTTDRCNLLKHQGYVVIDDFFTTLQAQTILQECQWLRDKGHMKPNKTQFTTSSGQSIQYSKPHITELDLHHQEIQQHSSSGTRTMIPHLMHLFDSSALSEILAQRTDIPLAKGPRTAHHHQTLKVQLNAGQGACFPWHYDNPGRPNRRKLTAILYLNEAHDPAVHGGELVFQPFLAPDVIAIRPTFNRLVIFHSEWLLHRVRPSFAPERWCVTFWFDDDDDASDDVNHRKDDSSEQRLTLDQVRPWSTFLQALPTSPLQRLFSRAVYSQAYLESIHECMADAHDNGSCSDMVRVHETYLAQVGRSPVYQHIISLLHQEMHHRKLFSP